VQDEVDADEGGWELDADGEGSEEKKLDEVEVPVEEDDSGPGATPGVSETELWVRNSPFAADHVAVFAHPAQYGRILSHVYCLSLYAFCSPIARRCLF